MDEQLKLSPYVYARVLGTNRIFNWTNEVARELAKTFSQLNHLHLQSGMRKAYKLELHRKSKDEWIARLYVGMTDWHKWLERQLVSKDAADLITRKYAESTLADAPFTPWYHYKKRGSGPAVNSAICTYWAASSCNHKSGGVCNYTHVYGVTSSKEDKTWWWNNYVKENKLGGKITAARFKGVEQRYVLKRPIVGSEDFYVARRQERTKELIVRPYKAILCRPKTFLTTNISTVKQRFAEDHIHKAEDCCFDDNVGMSQCHRFWEEIGSIVDELDEQSNDGWAVSDVVLNIGEFESGINESTKGCQPHVHLWLKDAFFDQIGSESTNLNVNSLGSNLKSLFYPPETKRRDLLYRDDYFPPQNYLRRDALLQVVASQKSDVADYYVNQHMGGKSPKEIADAVKEDVDKGDAVDVHPYLLKALPALAKYPLTFPE